MKNTMLYAGLKVIWGVASEMRDDLKKEPQITPQDPDLYNQNHTVVFNPILISNSQGPQALMWLSEKTKNNRTSTYIYCSTDPEILQDGGEKCTYLDNMSQVAELLPAHSNEQTRQNLVDSFVKNIRYNHASRAINSRRDLYSDF